jgi:hypothetical protein
VEDFGIDGRIIFWGVGLEIVDWIHVAQDRSHLLDLVNTVMSL